MRQIWIFLLLLITLTIYSQERFSLDEAVSYALDHNVGLQVKTLEIKDAEQDILGVRSIAMPKINGGVDYQYYFAVPAQPVPDFITPSIYGVLFKENVIAERDLGPPTINRLSFFQPHNLTGKLEASMLLFDGTYKYGLKASKVYRDLIQKQVDATEFEVRSAVRKAYVGALVASENMKIIDNNLKLLSKNLSDTRAMYDAGFAESLDVDRLQLSYEKLKTQRQQLVEMEQISKNVLKFQMGYPIDQDITLAEDLNVLMDQWTIELGDQVEVDITKRPEYDVIEVGEQINEIDYLRYRAGYLPTVRAFASAQNSLQRTNLFDNDESGWIPTSLAGLNINIPIYDGGEKKARMAKTKINAERIILQKQEFENAVTLEVTNAYIGLRNALHSLENTKNTIRITESIFERVNIKFKEGVGSSIEVAQAEASLYEAQASFINALYDVIVAKNNLEIASGNI